MTAAEETDESPCYMKCTVNIQRWSNRSPLHDQPLVDPHVLTDVNRALAICEHWVHYGTVPVLGENYRLVTPNPFGGFDEWWQGQNMLASALRELRSKWPDVLAEARARLGVNFRVEDYPDGSELETLWKANQEWEEGVSTLTLLKEYSAFFRPPTHTH